jgi:hypothetical protein
MPDDVDTLKKELAKVKAENQQLQLRLNNAILALKMEMTASGSLVRVIRPDKIVSRN